MRQHLWFIVSWCAIFALSVRSYLLSSPPSNDTNAIAYLEKSKGNIQIRSPQIPFWYAPRPQERLADGALVSTGSSSSASIQLIEGGQIILGPESQISVSHSENNNRDMLVNVIKGAVFIENTDKEKLAKNSFLTSFAQLTSRISKSFNGTASTQVISGNSEYKLSSKKNVFIKKTPGLEAEIRSEDSQKLAKIFEESIKTLETTSEKSAASLTSPSPIPNNITEWSLEEAQEWANFTLNPAPRETQYWTAAQPGPKGFPSLKMTFEISVPEEPTHESKIVRAVLVENKTNVDIPLEKISATSYSALVDGKLLQRLIQSINSTTRSGNISQYASATKISIRFGFELNRGDKKILILSKNQALVSLLPLYFVPTNKMVIRFGEPKWNFIQTDTWNEVSAQNTTHLLEFSSSNKATFLNVANAFQKSKTATFDSHFSPNSTTIWGINNKNIQWRASGIHISDPLTNNLLTTTHSEFAFEGEEKNYILPETCASNIRSQNSLFSELDHVVILQPQEPIKLNSNIFRLHPQVVSLFETNFKGCLSTDVTSVRYGGQK